MNRKKCKHCKEYFRPLKTLQHYCFDPECTKVWVTKEREKQWKSTKAKMKEDLKTVQDWMKEAQTVFNKYIRLRDKDKPCVSCGKPLREGNTDAGHLWSSGGHKFITFHEDNVNAQCSRPCNKDKHGDFGNYEEGLIKRIGEERVQWLRENRHRTARYTVDELKELIKVYKAKIKELTV